MCCPGRFGFARHGLSRGSDGLRVPDIGIAVGAFKQGVRHGQRIGKGRASVRAIALVQMGDPDRVEQLGHYRPVSVTESYFCDLASFRPFLPV